MPAILFFQGWKFSFFANEGNEPIHIHARKGDKQCKYWLHPETFSISEAYARGMNTRDKRHVIKIIMQNFEDIEKAWNKFHRRKYNGQQG